MNPKCIAEVQAAAKALGRKALTEAQLRTIDSQMDAKMRELARTDPEWRSKSRDQRVTEASQAVMADIQAAAARKVENAQRQIVATAATDERIQAQRALYDGEDRAGALVRDIEQTGHYVAGVKAEAMSNMVDLMEAAKSQDGAGFTRRTMMFLFDSDNPAMTVDLAREIFQRGDGKTGNKVATDGAKAYLDVIEGLRQRFNAAGGDVGRLDYGYLPQPHDAAKVRGRGDAAATTAWVDGILPKLDRSRYLLEDGSRMGDTELRSVLGRAWETISTGGTNKTEPGTFTGTGAKANAGSDARQIHFKDADAYLEYMGEFGTGGMYDAITGHVGRMARDISLIERYGPNPNAQLNLQFDLAARDAGRDIGDLPRSMGLRPQSYWEQLNGTAGTPQNASLAAVGMHVRNMQTFGKLGAAVISSVTDMGTFMQTTGYNKLPYWDALRNIGRTVGSADAREFLTTHGIIAESMAGDINRWTGENLRMNWSGRLANSTMRLSLMNAWTDSLRRAFSLTMMQGIARLSKAEWGSLPEFDRTLMERRGITEADWSVITRAQLTEFQGAQHLTPEAIRATGDERAGEVVAKVLGLIQDESEFAVLNPDLATKAIASGGASQSGTVRGELARSVMQFKSFPIAMVSRHWRRMLETPKVADGSAPALANRLLYAGALMVSTTALGAIALQAKQVIGGKDPVDMAGDHAGKFWAKAVAQGGGLSIVGDFLLSDPADNPGGFGANLAKTITGPAIGTGGEALALGVENTWRGINGKDTHFAANGLRLARSNAPYLGIWYARAAVDHAGMHALQENLSPGYLGKMRARAQKEFGQDYWWKPGTGGPQRAPDLAAAVGG